MKIKSITQIGNEISIITDTGESAVFYSFSAHKDVYTTTSPGLYKYQLKQFKKDIVKSEWNVEQLKEWYL
ncbi:hypothetical protein [Flavobacterium sp.]|jgi:hypothetical protein|uniref:hypothetical protein n=1 Tax=Flavobacterium sp. TaxID=239 RepID=UPI0037C15E38